MRINRIIAVLLPILVSIVFHYGFFTNYTRGTFNIRGFEAQYNTGVFRYRVIGNTLVSEIAEWMHRHPAMYDRFKSATTALNAPDDPVMYGAYFMLNTVSLVMVSALLYSLCAGMYQYLALLLLTAMTLYVVTPYDVLSYAVILAGILAVIRGWTPWLIPLMIIGTLVRETMILVIPFYMLSRSGTSRYTMTAALVAAFAVAYFGIRAYMGDMGSMGEIAQSGVILMANLDVRPARTLLGIGMLIVVLTMIVSARNNAKNALYFIAASMPYIVYVILVAQPQEIRLWVPVWLGAALIPEN
jgi:hypothetical protein